MNAYPEWLSLREIDIKSGQPKGSSFRLFKRLAPRWTESQDFVVLNHETDARVISALRDSGRIYASSVNVVLLSGAAAAELIDRFATPPPALR